MPPTFWAPGMITSVLAPMLVRVRWMARVAPLPISIMVITAADADDDAEGGEEGPHDVPPEGACGRFEDSVSEILMPILR